MEGETARQAGVEKLLDQFPQLHCHEQTPQLRCLMTILCNKETPRGEWVFTADRVNRLMIEFALNFLPTRPKTVTSPVGGLQFAGAEFAGSIVGVSIIRAGEALETALRSCARNVRIGKLLIQRNEETAEPIFYMAKLPSDIHKRHILLLDPMLATGGSALCAIEKLIEAGVEPSKIVFVTIVVSPEGVERVLGKHPELAICTANVAEGLDENSYIKRSVGDYGDKYFSA